MKQKGGREGVGQGSREGGSDKGGWRMEDGGQERVVWTDGLTKGIE